MLKNSNRIYLQSSGLRSQVNYLGVKEVLRNFLFFFFSAFLFLTLLSLFSSWDENEGERFFELQHLSSSHHSFPPEALLSTEIW